MEERKVKIAGIQMQSVMGDVKYNLQKAEHFLEKAGQEGAQIACLPELFYSGYHLQKEEFLSVAEKPDGNLFNALSKLAKDRAMYIIAPYPEKTDDPEVIYNSAMVIDDKGNLIGNMRKVYLWGKEKTAFKEGNKFPVYDTPYGKIGLLICYDVEFPEPPRILALKGAGIVFVPSVWSIGAKHRWDIDLPAASLFNLYFTVGVNTICDGACGNSKIVNPRGDVLKEASLDKEEIISQTLDLADISRIRSVIPYLKDFKPETFSMDAVKNF
ncbi:MAG: carbon-nitrogen hydrolase family protein [Clostridia bacterium]|nr:carbon-nitrogen hydrolase family protein [Clostridia bacterium]